MQWVIPGFEAEVEAETRQELGLSAMAAMMAEPSPAGLEWRCFGYPYIYPSQYWYRRCFFQLKDCFCVFSSWFRFWCKPQMVDSGRLVSQTQNSGCTSSCSRRWGTWLQNDGMELVQCVWDLIDVPIRYARYVLDLKRGDLDRCHKFTYDS